MVFVTLGTQLFPFDRLLKKVDELIYSGKIIESVFGQIGHSNYQPKYFEYKNYLINKEFLEFMNKCDTVITHGGTGSIISAVNAGKKVIAVPRMSKYGEHVDNHQVQIITQFDRLNIITPCYHLKDLSEAIEQSKLKPSVKITSNTNNFIKNIDNFLEKSIRK